MPPAPVFYTFSELSKKLGVSQTRIDKDAMAGKIKQFLIINLNYKAPEKTRNRISRLMPILNHYVSKHLLEDPSKIIYQFGTFNILLSDSQAKYLEDNVESNSIFELLLKEAGIVLDNIKLAIPRAEFLRYKKYLSKSKKTILHATKDNDAESKQVLGNQKYRPPSRKGCIGPIQSMILEGLQAYFDKNKRLPTRGNSFNIFLRFLVNEFKLPIKPYYFEGIAKLSYVDNDKEPCLLKKGEHKYKPKKYLSNEFSRIKKVFVPNTSTELPLIT